MVPWRSIGMSVAALGAVVAAGAVVVSGWVVLPPLLAATMVLTGAALSVDYFGIRRRVGDWTGTRRPGPAAWANLGALEARFARDRRRGSVHAAASARALLLAYAQLDLLGRAAGVVDCLAAESVSRFRNDVCGDALRALALSELGRGAEAARLDRQLGEGAGATPVVAWARARMAARRGNVADAITAIDRARAVPGSTVAHDLAALRARLVLRIGRSDESERVLRDLAATGGRMWVEQLADDSHVPLAQLARRALGVDSAYR
jgi:hypothetical protein